MKKRVLIADDHDVVRSGIKLVIKDILPLAVVHEAGSEKEVMSSVRENDYDLIILAVAMPDTESVALISHLFSCKKDSRVLIFGANAGKGRLPDRKHPAKENPFERLSAKERLIAQYYLKGYTSTEIKKILCLHASTIGTFKTRLFEKLQITSLIGLFELARLYQPEVLHDPK